MKKYHLIFFFLFLTFLIFNSSSFAALVGYWNFDEGSGTVAHDTSGYGTSMDGTLISMNNSNWQPGYSGTALNFNGTNQYVNVPNSADGKLDITGNLYLEAWIKPNWREGYNDPSPVIAKYSDSPSVTNDQYLLTLQQWGGGSNKGFALEGVLRGGTSWGDTDYVWYNASLSEIPIDEWTQVAFSFNDSTNELSVYINGMLKQSKISSIVDTIWSSSADVTIGQYEGHYFDGLIDEAKIFNNSQNPVPEPSTFLLLGAGIAGVAVFRKKLRS